MAITLNGSTGITTPADTVPEGRLYPLVSGTAVTSPSGTALNFGSIPSWVKRITVCFAALSTNGTSDIYLQLGTSGGIVSTGYLGSTTNLINATAIGVGATTNGMKLVSVSAASNSAVGQAVITNITGNTWAMTATSSTSSTIMMVSTGSITLGATLTQISVITSNGTDTFDVGSVNILYE